MPVELRQATASIHPLFNLPPERLSQFRSRTDATSAPAAAGRVGYMAKGPLPDLTLWYEIRLKPDIDAAQYRAQLKAQANVAIVELAPLPARLPAVTASFVANQGYLNAATDGIDAQYAWTQPGGNGTGVTIYDIEYSWNQQHEDLGQALGAFVLLAGGDVAVDPFMNTEHGTAVLGELVANRDDKGVTGIAWGANIGLAPANTQNLGYNPANAILLAMNAGQAGDVILLEQQATVCGLSTEEYGPLEWITPVFEAIQTATANGFVVVEAAGNGNVDLDQPGCNDLFDRAVRDSGAIIVGAGQPPSSGADRARESFSSYGSRVDVQGWGSDVVTTGYGNFYNDPDTPADANRWYTRFSGTSSASPIVAGAIANLQGVAQQQLQLTLDAGYIRALLVETGSPQQGNVAEHIGPRPNLRNLLERILDSRGGIEFFQTRTSTDFLVAGVGGMRNQGTGLITLSGLSGTVQQAYLYWHGPTNTSDPLANAHVVVNGAPITGLNIGFSNDNCWGYSNSQAYRADVTALVTSGGNTTYTLTNFGAGSVNTNGASLIVFFDDGNPANNRDVVIFDGNDSNIANAFDADGWNVDLYGINYSGGTVSLQMHVGDGQSFPDDALFLNGSTLVGSGAVFQGTTVPSANNGPAGNGSLWDIRAFDVTPFLSPGINTLRLSTGTLDDCLTLAVALIDLPTGSTSSDFGSIAGAVFAAGEPPVALPQAPVQICRTGSDATPGFCTTGFTNSYGQYIFNGLPPGQYLLTGYPPAGYNLQTATLGPLQLNANQTLTEQNLLLPAIGGIPDGVTITNIGIGNAGIPVIYWGDDLTLTAQGCPGGTASYSVTLDGVVIRSGALTEEPAGVYSGSIPAFYPHHGNAVVDIHITCPDGATEDLDFNVYIDPSGHVRTVDGAPIAGATVTLFRSDNAGGPFVQVPDGSALMAPANRTNPDLTDAQGHFGWDVVAGYYFVRAAAPNCVAPADHSQPYVDSAVLTIPPPVTDLDLRLYCGATVTRTLTLVSGWNLIALPVLLADNTPATIFADIAGQYQQVYAYNGCDTVDPWKKYDPASPFPFLNDLPRVGVSQGVWVRANSNATLTVTGSAPLNIAIPLCIGWNLISWPGDAPTPIATALAEIAGHYNLVYGYDAGNAANPWQKYNPSGPPFANTLTTLQAGRGYWIRVTQATTLTVE